MKSIFVAVEKCLGCKSCELACAVAHSASHSLYLAVGEDPPPVSRMSLEPTDSGPLPLQCRHCGDAPCVEACIAGALWRDKNSGTINLDEDRCVGCWTCIMVCPFGGIVSNRERNVAHKCDGREESCELACVLACPTEALICCEPEKLLSLKRWERARREPSLRRARSGVVIADDQYGNSQ